MTATGKKPEGFTGHGPQCVALLEQRDKLAEALRVLYVQVGLVVTDTDMAELLAPASEEAERVLREVDE